MLRTIFALLLVLAVNAQQCKPPEGEQQQGSCGGPTAAASNSKFLNISLLPLKTADKIEISTLRDEDLKSLDDDLLELRRYIEQRKIAEKQRKDQEEMRKPLYDSQNKTSGIIILNEQNFDEIINTPGKHKVVKLYADWCGYCRQFAPAWHVIGEAYNGKENIIVGVVNIDYSRRIAQRMDREGVPAVYYFSNETRAAERPMFYDGFRTTQDLAVFINGKTGLNVMVPGLEELIQEQKKKEKVLKLFSRPGTDVKIVHTGEWERLLGQKHVMAYFYFDSCKPCLKFAPFYEEMALAFADVQRVVLAAVNTDTDYELAAKYSVTQVPAIFWFKRGTSMDDKGHRIEGSINPETLVQFINQQINSRILLNGMTEAIPSDHRISTDLDDEDEIIGEGEMPLFKQYYGLDGRTPVVELTKSTFSNVVFDPRKSVVVEFYAEWCSYCKQVRKPFIQVAETFKSNKNIVIAAINADHFQSILSSQGIKGYPTIMIYRASAAKKSQPDTYNGDHTFADLVNWINQRTGASGSLVEPNVEKYLDPKKREEYLAEQKPQSPPVPEVAQRMERLESKLDKLIQKSDNNAQSE